MLPHEKKFVESLTRALSDSGLNKSELARKAGISHPQLFRYFKGVVPRYPVAVKLAEALGVSPIALLHSDTEELHRSSDNASEELHLIREEPAAMPYRFASPTPVLSSPPGPAPWVEKLARQTSDEIFSRLVQWPANKAPIRQVLRDQINARLDEFEALCDLHCKGTS